MQTFAADLYDALQRSLVMTLDIQCVTHDIQYKLQACLRILQHRLSLHANYLLG